MPRSAVCYGPRPPSLRHAEQTNVAPACLLSKRPVNHARPAADGSSTRCSPRPALWPLLHRTSKQRIDCSRPDSPSLLRARPAAEQTNPYSARPAAMQTNIPPAGRLPQDNSPPLSPRGRQMSARTGDFRPLRERQMSAQAANQPEERPRLRSFVSHFL